MTVRRLKTYAGGQGYVYQYYFVGKRAAAAAASETEYIFDVTSDRKTTYAVSILLPVEVVAEWASRHGRPLSEAEQYAAVKMRLFHAFDNVEDIVASGTTLTIDRGALESSLDTLGVN